MARITKRRQARETLAEPRPRTRNSNSTIECKAQPDHSNRNERKATARERMKRKNETRSGGKRSARQWSAEVVGPIQNRRQQAVQSQIAMVESVPDAARQHTRQMMGKDEMACAPREKPTGEWGSHTWNACNTITDTRITANQLKSFVPHER